ncbi:restriction endonuclease [Peribacillus sp. NPDC097197]|uniref:restriction endonuclease n=1 Tax=Peribacillus sp. NPDC097197 TaxID=3390615 RepID=UPI003CFD822A
MEKRESFTLNGSEGEGIIEQIDGVIEFDNKIFLVEMKWWDKPIGVGEVSQHLVRIFNRGQACGIFISTSPFTQPAVAICKDSLSKALIILINLEELYKLLKQDGDLKGYLKKKLQAAIINKDPYYIPL